MFATIAEDSNAMYWGPDVHMVGKELQYKKYSLEETATSYDGMGIQADSEYAELINYWLHRCEKLYSVTPSFDEVPTVLADGRPLL